MSAPAQHVKTITFAIIHELSWWRTKDGKRLMCVIEKWGKGTGKDYKTTELTIVEAGVDEKKRIPYQPFLAQVLNGNLLPASYVDVRDVLYTHGRTTST